MNGILNIIALSGFGEGVYRLANYSGALLAEGLHVGSAPAGYDYEVDYDEPKKVNLIVTAVPEPGMLSLGFGAIAFVALRRRRVCFEVRNATTAVLAPINRAT